MSGWRKPGHESSDSLTALAVRKCSDTSGRALRGRFEVLGGEFRGQVKHTSNSDANLEKLQVEKLRRSFLIRETSTGDSVIEEGSRTSKLFVEWIYLWICRLRMDYR